MNSIPELCRKIENPGERLRYLTGHEITTESRLMPDTCKARGMLMPVAVLYRPLCRGVRIGDWNRSRDVAVSEGESFLKRWNGLVR